MSAIRSLLAVHSGGPSTTLNAALAGVLDEMREKHPGASVFGARHGAAGLLSGDWIDLGAIPHEETRRVLRSPGSAIGTSRRPVSPRDAEQAVELLAERGVDCLIYKGGNGSMATALSLAHAAASIHPDLRVIGAPNTVDNDVAETDHTPGFPSAARFYALALRDIGEDNRALPSPVTVVEVIGRNVGWVTAATALARGSAGRAPHLIYTPEEPPELERIVADVRRSVELLGRAVVAVCEGLRDPRGEPFGADLDKAGDRRHELAQNLAHTLAGQITAATGLRARAERPGLLGRSCSLAISAVDLEESRRTGRAAVVAAAEGRSAVMTSLSRSAPEKLSSVELVPLERVAGIERTMPPAWAPAGDAPIAPGYEAYLRPLVGEIPELRAWTDHE